MLSVHRRADAMATLRDTFKSIEDWARRILTPPKEPDKSKEFWTPEMRAFLYAKEWVYCDSTHHKAAWFSIYHNECHFLFHDGKVYTVENFTTDDAVSYVQAKSKGEWYWSNIRVRGVGNFHKTQKPYRPGM
jgi:hypothetical protein